MEFPYKKLFCKKPEWYYKNLTTKCYLAPAGRSNGWKFGDKEIQLCIDNSAYDECDCITDLFTEPNRIRANIKDCDSPYVFFH